MSPYQWLQLSTRNRKVQGSNPGTSKDLLEIILIVIARNYLMIMLSNHFKIIEIDFLISSTTAIAKTSTAASIILK
uniref:Uncharacterized protein n=1 Tax=Romanomermis culicivorax TaxID=13658 RepID=A0A915JFM6_ROMCU